MPESDFEAAFASLAAVLVPLNRTAPERVMTSAFCAEAGVRNSMPEQPRLTQSGLPRSLASYPISANAGSAFAACCC